MKRWSLVVALLALAAIGSACMRSVARPTTAADALRRVGNAPRQVYGLILQNGDTVDLPGSAVVTTSGDSLILKQAGERRLGLYDTIRVADVTHVVVHQTNVGKSLLVAFVVVPMAVLAVVAIADALTKEPDPPPETSCPFIFGFDGSAFVAAAEPLGGAVSAGLQRADLSELEGMRLVDGSYVVMIGNEMREEQHLDEFSLVTADHPAGTTVVADHHGSLHAIGATVAPVRARTSSGEDLLPALGAFDEQLWSALVSADAFPGVHTRDTITLSFPRPAHDSAVLVLHTRTSQLAAHSLRVMLELWGGEVDQYYAMLDGSAPARAMNEEWVQREELWVLKVWVRERGGWVAQDVAVGGGPFITERQAVRLDLRRVEGDQVDVQLHPPRGYWDIDAVALDTARAAPPILGELSIAEVYGSAGQAVLAQLSAADGERLVMPEGGERIQLRFSAAPPAPGMNRTVFSRTTGFYRITTDRSGTRQAARLDSVWLEPGYPVRLAERYYLEAKSRQAAH